MLIQAIVATHPQTRGVVSGALLRAIEAADNCAQVCTACADACLAEADAAQLASCIRFNLDCASLCATAGAVATRRTGSNELVTIRLLDICQYACRLCATECQRHAGRIEHCRICAETCQACARACRDAADTIAPALN